MRMYPLVFLADFFWTSARVLNDHMSRTCVCDLGISSREFDKCKHRLLHFGPLKVKARPLHCVLGIFYDVITHPVWEYTMMTLVVCQACLLASTSFSEPTFTSVFLDDSNQAIGKQTGRGWLWELQSSRPFAPCNTGEKLNIYIHMCLYVLACAGLVFIFEAVVKLIGLGPRAYFRDAACRLDFIIALGMIGEAVLWPFVSMGIHACINVWGVYWYIGILLNAHLRGIRLLGRGGPSNWNDRQFASIVASV
jgi:Ion transport protein